MCKFCLKAKRDLGMFDEQGMFNDAFDDCFADDENPSSMAKIGKQIEDAVTATRRPAPAAPPKPKPMIKMNFFAKNKVSAADKNARLSKVRALRKHVEPLLVSKFGLQDPVVSISEVQCPDPECPDLETMIACLDKESPVRIRVVKPLLECTIPDVDEAMEEALVEFRSSNNKKQQQQVSKTPKDDKPEAKSPEVAPRRTWKARMTEADMYGLDW